MKSRREEVDRIIKLRKLETVRNRTDKEIRNTESILSGTLSQITGYEAAEARVALHRLLAHKKQEFNECVEAITLLQREQTEFTTGWSR